MPRASTSALASGQRAESRDPSKRYVPLCLAVREQIVVEEGAPDSSWTRSNLWVAPGDIVLGVGGAWDLSAAEFVDPAITDHGRVELSIHPGQVRAMEWFAGWLVDYLAGVRNDDEAFSCILSGGQRAGKTWVASVFAAAFAIAVPDSIVWIVCPTDDGFEEIDDILSGPDGILAGAWYEKTDDHYWFANGARIWLRSAHDPEALKVGRADLIVMNECQRMKKKTESVCRMRVADRGGMVIGCANPPDREIGQWVGDWVAETESGARQGVHFWFNPFDNPHVDHRRLRELETQMDARLFGIEVLGKFYSAGNVVHHNWDRRVNETTLKRLAAMFGVASLRDITREVTRQLEGRAFDRVLGVDVQISPMASGELRFFENPLAPMPASQDDRERDTAWLEWCLSVFVDECILDGQEEDLVEGWRKKNWDPEKTLIVCDASADWQFAGVRDPAKVEARRKQTKGRGSWDVFRAGDYKHIVPPDRDMARNPEVLERCRASTSRIATGKAGRYGRHFLFVLSTCRDSCRAIRKWPNTKRGQPSRDSEYAHVGDMITYPIHRFFPRKYQPDEAPKVEVIERFEGRRRTTGWAGEFRTGNSRKVY